MDSDALKRRITQELHDQFEGKLRDARREKSEAEEELESASERWRTERRRLNQEIDRLEAALTEAKTVAVRKPAEGQGDSKENAAEWKNRLTAAEERMASATGEWEAERGRLESEIERLESSVTEILERSNNPVRSLHAIQQKLESQLQDAVGAKQRLEEDFARAKASWEEERLKISGELFRLRRTGGATTDSPPESVNDAALQRAKTEIDQLRRQLNEAKEEAKEAAKSAAKSARAAKSQEPVEKPTEKLSEKVDELNRKNNELNQELASAKTSLEEETRRLLNANEQLEQARADVQRIEADMAELRQASSERATRGSKVRYAHQIEELEQEKAALAEKLEQSDSLVQEEKQRAAAIATDLEHARAEIERLGHSLTESRDAARSEVAGAMGEQYAAELEAAVKEKATLEGKLASADALLSQERKRAATQAEELRQAHETLEQYEKSGGRRNAGAVKVATERMRAEYGDKMQEMAQEKTNLVAQLENASATIEDERQRFAALNEQLSQAQAEIQKLEKQLSGSAGGSSDNAPVSQDDFAAQLQALTQEKASLIEQLERANASVAQERNLAAAVTEELRRARHKAQRGGAARDSGNAETESQSQYLEKMQEISTEKDALAGQLEKANRLLEEERQRFETLNEEVRRSRLETDQLERRLTEGGAGVDSEVIDQLRSQYAAKLEEIAQEKTDLAGRLEQASALLAQERQRFANASNGGSGSVDHAAIEQEVARVEGAIAEITQFIDDPSAQLAAVIRKNVERAELDAYLKGILFARGEMKGVC